MPITSATYKHPYGGTAIDKYVTRRRFARIFNYQEFQLDFLPTECKVGDVVIGEQEVCGYIFKGPRGGRKFVLTVINYK